MTRLTKKFNGEYYPKNANTIIFNTEIDYNVIQKLGKLEDLEEELGCPLQEALKDKINSKGKKPIIQKELPYLDFEIPTCPNCGLHLSLEQRYCDRCGQKLDWSDENESNN